MDSASSTNSLAVAMFCGSSPCNNVLRTLPTVWCILSHMVLACGFFALVQTSLIRQFCKRVWNSDPLNSPPESCTHLCGHGYRDNQHWAYLLDIVSYVLSSTLISSTKLVTVSIHVKASNSYGLPWTWTIHGSIRSTAHSSNGIDRTSRSGKSPYPFPSSLFHWQWSQLKLPMYRRKSRL